MTAPAPPPAQAGAALWADALTAAALLAVDPAGLNGICLRAPAGPVRDAWLEGLAALMPGVAWRRVAAGVPEGRLVGGLDLAATLAAGAPVAEAGILAAVDGGVLALAMAERLPPVSAALLAAALDERCVRVERDGLSRRHAARFLLVALDEGASDDEGLPPVLGERLGLRLDLDALSPRGLAAPSLTPQAVAAAQARLAGVAVSPEMLEALCVLPLAAGKPSVRAALFLFRAARAAAALRGAQALAPADCALAARLVLGLAGIPPEEDAAPPQAPEPEPPPAEAADGETRAMPEGAIADTVLQAIAAHLPKGLLDGALRETLALRAGVSGKAGAPKPGGRRGRRVGVSERPPHPGARLDVLATLRAAAPWQRLRRPAGAGPGGALAIRKGDFRYPRLQERTGTTAICVLDASGSAAVERLAEAKGAVELLLAQAYVRRDSVALIAFRGKAAETLLEPTRALARAKRSVTALPGGGGTPLAAGILAALRATLGVRGKGGATVTVFLTDGRGNVALDGSTGKAGVEADVAAAARSFRAKNLPAIVIDTAQRPRGQSEALARSLGARYLALPRAGSQALAGAILAGMEKGDRHAAAPP